MGHSQIQTASLIRPSRSASLTLPQCVFLDRTQLAPWLDAHQANLLAIISFARPVPDSFHCPVIRLDLPELMAPSQLEVWSTTYPVQTYYDEGFSASASRDFMFGTLTLDEQPGQSIDTLTDRAYRRLLHFLQELAYPHLWRVWNYFPNINGLVHGLERYQQFCLGRHWRVRRLASRFSQLLPAGTAVGTRSGPLQSYFVAGSPSRNSSWKSQADPCLRVPPGLWTPQPVVCAGDPLPIRYPIATIHLRNSKCGGPCKPAPGTPRGTNPGNDQQPQSPDCPCRRDRPKTCYWGAESGPIQGVRAQSSPPRFDSHGLA